MFVYKLIGCGFESVCSNESEKWYYFHITWYHYYYIVDIFNIILKRKSFLKKNVTTKHSYKSRNFQKKFWELFCSTLGHSLWGKNVENLKIIFAKIPNLVISDFVNTIVLKETWGQSNIFFLKNNKNNPCKP